MHISMANKIANQIFKTFARSSQMFTTYVDLGKYQSIILNQCRFIYELSSPLTVLRKNLNYVTKIVSDSVHTIKATVFNGHALPL